MKEDLTREATMQLVGRITHPALVLGNFLNKYKLVNLQRFPYSVFSAEEEAEVKAVIDNVISRMEEAAADPSLDHMNEVLALKQVKKSACGSPALLSRLYKGRIKEGDLEHLKARFQELIQHMRG